MTNLTSGLFSVVEFVISDIGNDTNGGEPEDNVNDTDVLCISYSICNNRINSPILGQSGSSLKGAPTWDVVRNELRWLFLLHAYGFACSFFILAFYGFFSILNIRSLISSRPFMSTINMFLCLLGISRAASLFIDPYHLKGVMPKVLGSVIWDIGYPSIVAAFSLVQLAFLQLTQLKLGPEEIRSKSCLSLIITGHFTCIIGFDVVLAFHSQFQLIWYIVQTLFLVWGIVLCCTFIYAGYRVKLLLRNMPSALLQHDFGDVNCKGIMQLAMLAPYNNLATSVAAALVPTLLAPRFGANSLIVGASEVNRQEAGPSSAIPSLRPKSSLSNRSATSQRIPDMLSRQKSNYSLIPSTSCSPNDSPNKICDNAAANEQPSTSRIGDEKQGPLTPKLKKNLSWGNTLDAPPPETMKMSVNKAKLSFKTKKLTSETLSDEEDQPTASTSLLPQQPNQVEPPPSIAGAGPDLTLHTILNHIAYVNRAAAHSDSGLAHAAPQATPASRKQQVSSVLRVTYATAFTGLLLCIANIFKIYGPYGIHSHGNITPWPWFCFETLCRAMELGMGCAMANVTKQPTPRQRYMHHHSMHIKQHRESLFI